MSGDSPRRAASSRAAAQISTGRCVASPTTGIPSWAPRVLSWSTAAGRYTSAAASNGCCPCFWKWRASFAALVVLPEPCRPTSITTVGGWGAIARRWAEPPSSSTSSSRTTLTTCCPGVSDWSTSCPTALTRTRSMKPFTTLKLTSASSRATRTSRRASWMFSSVNRPNPRSRSRMPVRRLVRLSSIEFYHQGTVCGNAKGY